MLVEEDVAVGQRHHRLAVQHLHTQRRRLTPPTNQACENAGIGQTPPTNQATFVSERRDRTGLARSEAGVVRTARQKTSLDWPTVQPGTASRPVWFPNFDSLRSNLIVYRF